MEASVATRRARWICLAPRFSVFSALRLLRSGQLRKYLWYDSGGRMSGGERRSLGDLLSSVLLLPPSLSAFWLGASDAASPLNNPTRQDTRQPVSVVR